MAKKPTDTVRMSFEIELKAEHIPLLEALIETPPGTTMSPMQKIRDITEDLLTQMAGGAVVFSPEEVQQVADSTGVTLTNADDLIPYITEVSGMVDGMHRVVVLIDPANFPAYEELARTQERSVDDLMQETVDMVQSNDWVYELHPRPRTVLMTEAAAAELEAILGAKFQTGSELAELVRQHLAPKEETAVDLFEADQTNVGAEA